jgi:hypothetical protein
VVNNGSETSKKRQIEWRIPNRANGGQNSDESLLQFFRIRLRIRASLQRFSTIYFQRILSVEKQQ